MKQKKSIIRFKLNLRKFFVKFIRKVFFFFFFPSTDLLFISLLK